MMVRLRGMEDICPVEVTVEDGAAPFYEECLL